MTKLTKAEREELPARIEAAIATVCSGMAAMSIPANPRDVDLVLADCAKALADLDAAEAERDARSDEAYEARELRSVLLRHNFAPCDTAACNCNGWHERSTGNGFYARFREIDEAVGEHDGQTLLDAVKQIVVERKAAVLWAEKAEKAMTCKGCGGTVSDHLAPDQGGCPGSFEIDGVQMVPLAGRDNAEAQRDRAEAERDAERKMRVEAEAAAEQFEEERDTLKAHLDDANENLAKSVVVLAKSNKTRDDARKSLESLRNAINSFDGADSAREVKAPVGRAIGIIADQRAEIVALKAKLERCETNLRAANSDCAEADTRMAALKAKLAAVEDERDKALADVAKYADRSESLASSIDHMVSNTADSTDLARIAKERDDFRDGMVAMLVAAGAPADLDGMEEAVSKAGDKPSDFVKQRIRVLTEERDALWTAHRDVVDERDALKAKLAALANAAEVVAENYEECAGFGELDCLAPLYAAIAAARGGA